MTLGEVIKEYRTEHHISMKDFGQLIGASKQYISILERNVNPSTGRPPNPTLDKIAAVANVIGESLDSLLSRLDADTVVSFTSAPATNPMPATTLRPRLGTIACGAPILAENNIECYDSVPDYIRCDFTLECRGDSMVNARICDGDIVCVKQQPMVENGQIAAVLIDDGVTDGATLKRVRFTEDGIVLWPENQNYAPMVFTGKDVEKVRILGLATHFISTIK